MNKDTLEMTQNISILGYNLEVYPIEQFKLFYDQCTTFNSFSEKAFLKAIKIPPQYFLEQPEETKEELLLNKEEILTEKLAGKYLVILKKGNEVVNCARVDYNELQNLDERISLSKENLAKLIPVRDFVKEGYLSNFISKDKLEEGKYNLGIFIDYPLLLNKTPVVNIGFYYVPKKGEDNYKNLYVETQTINFDDYHSLDLLIEDVLNIKIKEIEEQKIIETLKDIMLLREIDEVLLKLCKEKVIPKSYVKKISKYIFKNELLLPNVFSLIDLLLSYEPNFNSYKQVFKIRSCVYNINLIVNKTKEDRGET